MWTLSSWVVGFQVMNFWPGDGWTSFGLWFLIGECRGEVAKPDIICLWLMDVHRCLMMTLGIGDGDLGGVQGFR